MPAGSEFGRYIGSVGERDVDFLLLEEFHISADFVSWFCKLLGIENALPDGAWHSVSNTDGESDLVLRIRSGNRRIGILIENKISAPEQDQQSERYHLRGITSQEEGKFEEYVTVMCAPQRYLDGLSSESLYQKTVSYEEIASWYEAQGNSRASWRNHVMREAIHQGRRGYKMVVNPEITAFHRDYWEHLRSHHPLIKMAKPGDKGNKSTWIILWGHTFPKKVKIHHKFDQSVIELGFSGRRIDEIMAKEKAFPESIAVVQKEGDASLAIQVPHVNVREPFSSQVQSIEVGLAAAYKLMPFANILAK